MSVTNNVPSCARLQCAPECNVDILSTYPHMLQPPGTTVAEAHSSGVLAQNMESQTSDEDDDNDYDSNGERASNVGDYDNGRNGGGNGAQRAEDQNVQDDNGHETSSLERRSNSRRRQFNQSRHGRHRAASSNEEKIKYSTQESRRPSKDKSEKMKRRFESDQKDELDEDSTKKEQHFQASKVVDEHIREKSASNRKRGRKSRKRSKSSRDFKKKKLDDNNTLPVIQEQNETCEDNTNEKIEIFSISELEALCRQISDANTEQLSNQVSENHKRFQDGADEHKTDVLENAMQNNYNSGEPTEVQINRDIELSKETILEIEKEKEPKVIIQTDVSINSNPMENYVVEPQQTLRNNKIQREVNDISGSSDEEGRQREFKRNLVNNGANKTVENIRQQLSREPSYYSIENPQNSSRVSVDQSYSEGEDNDRQNTICDESNNDVNKSVDSQFQSSASIPSQHPPVQDHVDNAQQINEQRNDDYISDRRQSHTNDRYQMRPEVPRAGRICIDYQVADFKLLDSCRSRLYQQIGYSANDKIISYNINGKFGVIGYNANELSLYQVLGYQLVHEMSNNQTNDNRDLINAQRIQQDSPIIRRGNNVVTVQDAEVTFMPDQSVRRQINNSDILNQQKQASLSETRTQEMQGRQNVNTDAQNNQISLNGRQTNQLEEADRHDQMSNINSIALQQPITTQVYNNQVNPQNTSQTEEENRTNKNQACGVQTSKDANCCPAQKSLLQAKQDGQRPKLCARPQIMNPVIINKVNTRLTSPKTIDGLFKEERMMTYDQYMILNSSRAYPCPTIKNDIKQSQYQQTQKELQNTIISQSKAESLDRNELNINVNNIRIIQNQGVHVQRAVPPNRGDQDVKADTETNRKLLFEDDIESIRRRYPDMEKSWASYPWLCCYCGITSPTIQDVRVHSKHVHNACYGFDCFICDNNIEEFDSFIDHMRKHKPNLRLYCEYCNQNYMFNSSQHIKAHLDRGVRCRRCGEILPDNAALDDHQRRYRTRSEVIKAIRARAANLPEEE